MGDCMPKEQEEFINKIQNDCLESTNMTKEEAYDFAFRCWQLGYTKFEVHKLIGKLEKIRNLEIIMHGGRCNGKTLKLGYAKGIENAIQTVKEFAEGYDNGWIPCSERLPETEGYYLVTYKFALDTKKRCHELFYGAPLDKRKRQWLLDQLEPLGEEITVYAWQPLPEPYKEKEE